MRTKKNSGLYVAIFTLVVASLACQAGGFLATETPTPLPTSTATATATVKPTLTLRPTFTPRPTATPNIAATQKFDEFGKMLEEYEGMGYVASAKGDAKELDDFKEKWAQMNYYRFFMPTSEEITTDFVFKSHIVLETASTSSTFSGCGIVFGLQKNGDHYLAAVGHDRIYFGMNRGNRTYQVGKTRGPGRLKLENPGEADVVISVKGQTAFVSVNGEVTEYTLSVDQTTKGIFAFSLLSGTNKDYGTRCEMTDSILWMADK